jgi:hypothetical protein
MRTLLSIFLFLIIVTEQVSAQSVDAPSLQEGDKWIYNVAEEVNSSGVMQSSSKKWINTISRAGSKFITLTSKPIDSNLPPKEFLRNIDWSSENSLAGKPTITSKPYSFPLESKKVWKIEFIEQNPNQKVKIAKTTKEYTVIGWETVTVPAGTYKAIKVEMNGDWYVEFNTIAPTSSTATTSGESGATAVARSTAAVTPPPASGRLYQAYWYVPDLKSHIKLVGEEYNAGGQLNKRHIEELDSVK